MNTNSSGANRRRAGRLVCDGLECQYGLIADLSGTGMRMLSKKLPPMDVGEVAKIRFTGLGDGTVLPAQLVRLIKKKDGWFEAGFKFWSLDEVQIRQLGNLARIAADRRTLRIAC
jgi:hypothetical protein